MMLECNLTTLGYHKTTVLHDVSFRASEGEMIAVIGKNGSGKSTLLSALAGLLPYEGSIRLDGRELSSLAPRERATLVSLMAQLPRTPHVSVERLLLFGRTPYRTFAAPPSEADRTAVEAAIRAAELEDVRHAYLDQLSGGEVRRAYFGLLLAQNTPLVLTDEATAHLDPDREHRFAATLRDLRREKGKTVISVTHSLEQALLADRVLVLDGGAAAFFGTPKELLHTDTIERIFSVHRYRATDESGIEHLFFSSI